jgi:hypothetical protein
MTLDHTNPLRNACVEPDGCHLGRSWKAEALRIWGVEVLVVELHGDVRAGIHDAQVRQFR